MPGLCPCGRDLVPLDRLIVGLALLPVPLALSGALLGKGALAGTAVGVASMGATSGVTGSGAVAAGVKAGILGQLTQAIGAHPVATAVTAATLVAGAAVSTATWTASAPPDRPVIAAPTSAPVPTPVVSAPTAAPAMSDPPPVVPSPKRPSPAAAIPSSTGTAPFAAGFASLESVNAGGLVVTTADDLGVLQQVDAGADASGRERATFEVIRGLADPGCVSFRARDSRYLRHSSWRLRLSQPDGTELFRGDATFCVRVGSVPDSVSFESFNYPGVFVRHRGTELWGRPVRRQPGVPRRRLLPAATAATTWHRFR